MPYQTLAQYNATGMDDILLYVSTQVPILIPLLLFGIWIIITFSIFYGTKRATGDANFFVAAAPAGWFVTILSILMTLKDGLINPIVMATCLAVTALLTVGLFFSREQ